MIQNERDKTNNNDGGKPEANKIGRTLHIKD